MTGNGADVERATKAFIERGLAHVGVLVVPSSLDGSEFAAIVERLAQWENMHPDGLPTYFSGYLNALT